MKLVALWTIAALITGSYGANCRCTDSKAACWPTQQEWSAFNATIGGRLIAPKPTGKPHVLDRPFACKFSFQCKSNMTEHILRI